MEMTPVCANRKRNGLVTVYQYNLLEFNPQATSYGITSTPTLIHFRDEKKSEEWSELNQQIIFARFSLNMNQIDLF